MPAGPPHSYVGGMSQRRQSSTPFTHPLVLWTVLRDRPARRRSTTAVRHG